MLKKERHDFVLRHVNLHNRLLTNDLVQILNVSEDTVRRDLKELSDDNLLRRVHGGAMARACHTSIVDDAISAKEAKINMAKKITHIIKNGMVVLVGGGEIIIELAKQLPKTLIGTFFTISPLAAVELTKFKYLEVILLGGLFSKESGVTYGGQVISQVSEIKADLCILEANGIDLGSGLTDSEWEISQLKKAMLNAAQKSAILCHSKNLNTTLSTRITTVKDIDYLVTDLDSKDVKLEDYQAIGLSIR